MYVDEAMSRCANTHRKRPEARHSNRMLAHPRATQQEWDSARNGGTLFSSEDGGKGRAYGVSLPA